MLESGTGSLHVVDPADGRKTTACRLPGYVRGLAFFDRYAFVGLSRIRGEQDQSRGLPIENMRHKLKCAVVVVDLSLGQEVGIIKFDKGVEELFDVQVLPGVQNPFIVGFEDKLIDGLFIFPQ